MKRWMILLLLVGCAKPETTYQGVDSDLEPYIRELQALSLRHTGQSLSVNIPVNFHPIDKAGQCRKQNLNGQEAKEIFIQPNFFRSADDGSILATLLHEIGHCVYDKPHEDKFISLGGQQAPESVMNSHSVPGNVFLSNLGYYFREFYN